MATSVPVAESLRLISRQLWVRNEDRKNCQKCKRDFNWFYWRHHCRACGEIFCYECSSYRMMLNVESRGDGISERTGPHRVCDHCIAKLSTVSDSISTGQAAMTTENARNDNPGAITDDSGYVQSDKQLVKSESEPTIHDKKQTAENKIFLALLRGDFSAFESASKLVPKAKLSVFVSSTFTDTKLERDWLMEEILPDLQEKGRQHGVQVTFADMRFGIKDESTLDHETWNECAKQLRYCYDESDGLFFLSLQADKYGYMPLPKYLDQSTVDSLAVDMWSEEERRLLAEWYIRDENSLSKHFVLKPMAHLKDSEFWDKAYPALMTRLTGVMLDKRLCDQLMVGGSVTQWELSYALELCKGHEDRCAWISRSFLGGIPQASEFEPAVVAGASLPNDKDQLNWYCDFVVGADQQTERNLSKEKHSQLIDLMSTSIPVERTIQLQAPPLDSYRKARNLQSLPLDHYFDQYKVKFITAVTSMMEAEISTVERQMSAWKLDGRGVGVSGAELSEMLHHCKLLRDKCSTFTGRQALLDQAIAMIKESKSDSSALDICLSIIGQSGVGKTALMAKLASEVSLCRYFPTVPTIVRFCGTSRGSADGLSLISSICRQIQLIYRLNSKSLPSVYEKIVKYFHELLNNYPVVLFIDSLDQLTDADFVRSKLSFLVGLKCHRKTRVIVSALPDEKDADGKWKYIYLCDTRLKESAVPRITLSNFKNDRTEAESILIELLSRRDRCMTPVKLSVVLDRVMEEPTALYLNLASLVVTKWTSSMSPNDTKLIGTVRGLINQLFDSLEVAYGKQLSRWAIGFLTFAKAGVSDSELQDLLSLRDEVLVEVFEHWQPSKYRRVPLSVVLRLREAMHGLLVERAGGCWSWYHRQLRETAEDRYKSKEALPGRHLIHNRIEALHETMGLYFTNAVSGKVMAERLISQQSLIVDNSSIWFLPEVDASTKINYRRCMEGLYHLVRAGSSPFVLECAVQEVCSLETICATIMAGEGFEVVNNISILEKKVQSKNSSSSTRTKLNHYARWLRQDMSLMAPHEKSARNWVNSSAMNQPKCSEVRLDMFELLKETSSIKNIAFTSLTLSPHSWTRCRTLGGKSDFDAMIATFSGHKASVWSVYFSSDGSRIVSGSVDNTVKVWDAVSGACVSTLEGHTSAVSSVCMSADGSLIVSGSYDNTVKVWDPARGTCISTLKGHTSYIYSVLISADWSRIVSGSGDNTVKVWDTVSKACVSTLEGHTGSVRSVCMSADGSRIISGSDDGFVKVWDTSSDLCVSTLEGHKESVMSVCMSLDGSRIISGSNDGSVKVWVAVGGACVSTLEGHTSDVKSVCVSADGSRIVSGSDDKTVRVWDSLSGACVSTLEGHNVGIYSVCVSADGFHIVSGSGDMTVCVWHAASGVCAPLLEGHSEAVRCVCESTDGSRIVSGSADKTVKVWDALSGACISTLEGHTSDVKSVCMSADGSRIVSGSDDKTVRVWDSLSGACVSTLEGHTDTVWSVCVSADGSRIVSGSSDNTVRVWDALSGACVSTLEGHTSRVTSVCVSADGSRIVSGSSDNTVRVWDTVSGACVSTLEGHKASVWSVCMSADGSRIMSGSQDRTVRVWNAASGACVSTLEGHTSRVTSVCVSADESHIVSGSYDKTVKVWDAASGACVSTLEGHTGWVFSVCLSADGFRIVSSSWDKTVRVWDVVNESCLSNSKGHDSWVGSVSVNADGCRIISSSQDKVINIFEATQCASDYNSGAAHHNSFLGLLRGDFSAFESASKLVPKAKLSVFVSSTFTDTKLERDWLMEEILPQLQEGGRQHGVLVTFADMRFGIKDESTLDHETWNECAKQLRYCYDESDGLFFLSLQADKYGYMPLPKLLPQSVADPVVAGWDAELQQLFHEWYILDENSIRKQYVLKSLVNLKNEDVDRFWKRVFPILENGLAGVVCEENSSKLVIGSSVTKWELQYALSLAQREDRLAWFRRVFVDDETTSQSTVDPSILKDYCDFASNTNEAVAIGTKHAALIKSMQSHIPASRVTEVSAPSLPEYLSNALQAPYTRKFVNFKSEYMTRMTRLFDGELDSVIQKVSAWQRDGNGLNATGDELNEMFHHCKIAVDKCSTFQGRQDLVNRALGILRANRISSPTMDVCLSIIGVSGAGKTALMAKLARECVSRRLIPDVPVIVRFCGTSRGSVDGLGVVTSICRQIQLCYGLVDETIPSEYEDAVQYFHKLILKYPVIVFIDSLDQLTDANFARSKLSFLVGLKCHPSSRVIVSALPDEKEPGSLTKWKYIYLCDTRLKEAQVDRVTLTSFKDERSEVEAILAALLSLRGRVIPVDQLSHVLDLAMVEPTALYLNLAVLVVSKWTSSMPAASTRLEATVRGLTNQVFDGLETVYGKHLTRQMIGFLTFAKAGVSDMELQDLLSLCEDVLEEVFKHWQPSKYKRVPLAVVLRLREGMRGLLVERAGGCWSWYHRQLRETAEDRYKSREAPPGRHLIHKRIESLHETMGMYFANAVPGEVMAERLISAQNRIMDGSNIWFQPERDTLTKFNYRRCVEGLYHLVRAGSLPFVLECAVQEACSLEGVCASIIIGEGFEYVKSISMLEQTAISTGMSFPKLTHYARWLRQDMSLMAPHGYSARLWVNSSAMTQPKCSIVRQNMTNVLAQTRQSKKLRIREVFDDKSWIQNQTLGGKKDFDALQSTLLDHTDTVRSVCMSADGSRIVSGADDKTVKVWDAVSGACVMTLEGHSESVKTVCMSADGSRIVSGADDKTVKVWDAVSGACVMTLEGHSESVKTVCMSADGSRIVSGSGDTTVKVWDAVSGACVMTLEGHTDTVRSVCVSADGSRIVSGSGDTTVKVWDAVSGACVSTLNDHISELNSVCMSADGSRIVSGSNDPTIKVWDAASGECVMTLEGYTSDVTSVCVSVDGSRIVSGSGDNTVRVWDAVSGACVSTLESRNGWVYSVYMSADGSRIVSGSRDKAVEVWDAVLKGPRMSVREGHFDTVRSVCMSSDGSRIVSGSYDKIVRVWDAVSGACVMTLEGHASRVNSVCMSADGFRIVSGSDDKTMKVWDAVGGACVMTLEGHSEFVRSVCMSADGSCIVSGADDKTVKVWDAVSGACVTLEGHSESVKTVCMSADGSRIVSGSGDTTVKVWDEVSGACVMTLEGHTKTVWSVCMSADGSRIVSGSIDKTLRMWDAVSGACVSTLEGHTSAVWSVCISADGSRIVSGSGDKTVRVWDAVSGACVSTLEGHTSDVTSVCVSADGFHIVSGSWDSTVRVWDIMDICSDEGHTDALKLAILNGRVDMVYSLLQNGAKLDEADLVEVEVDPLESQNFSEHLTFSFPSGDPVGVLELFVTDLIDRVQSERKVAEKKSEVLDPSVVRFQNNIYYSIPTLFPSVSIVVSRGSIKLSITTSSDAIDNDDDCCQIIGAVVLFAIHGITSVTGRFFQGIPFTTERQQVTEPIAPPPSTRRHVMISYAWSQNKERVVQLTNRLKALGVNTWRDEEGSNILPPLSQLGEIYYAMAQAIEMSSHAIIFVSRAYKNSKNCKLELEYLMTRIDRTKLLFVRLENPDDFTPTGILGIALGAKIFRELYEDADVEQVATELAAAILR